MANFTLDLVTLNEPVKPAQVSVRFSNTHSHNSCVNCNFKADLFIYTFIHFYLLHFNEIISEIWQ